MQKITTLLALISVLNACISTKNCNEKVRLSLLAYRMKPDTLIVLRDTIIKAPETKIETAYKFVYDTVIKVNEVTSERIKIKTIFLKDSVYIRATCNEDSIRIALKSQMIVQNLNESLLNEKKQTQENDLFFYLFYLLLLLSIFAAIHFYFNYLR